MTLGKVEPVTTTATTLLAAACAARQRAYPPYS